MLRLIFIGFAAIFVSYLSNNIYNLIFYQYIPDIDENFWWGPGNGDGKNDGKIYSFTIEVTETEIADLYHRLNNTRGFTPALENVQCQYGLSASVLDNIIRYLKEQYNVEERLQYLNSLPQFKTQIQGINIHFVHIKPKTDKSVKSLPILLLHGWPSSVREYYEIVSTLTKEQHLKNVIFELVIPSLPGFGYSDSATKSGFRGPHAATIFKALMFRLGHQKFLVHGSDWGAIIGAQMATLYPDNVLGYHTNFCFSLRPISIIKWVLGSIYPRMVVDDRYADKMYPLFNSTLRFFLYESGYMHLMGTKPDTIGHGLDNSPEALLSYLLEKISIGTTKNNAYKEDAGLSELNVERLMDNILFYYWFPKKATTAGRIYAENLQVSGLMEGLNNVPVDQKVPCGCAFFEHEFIYQPESFLRDKLTNLVHYQTYDRGGHFAMLEVPEVMVNDLITFIKKAIKVV